MPKVFRCEGLTEVLIERDGDRAILSPGRRPSIERLIGALDQFESLPDREQATLPEQRELC